MTMGAYSAKSLPWRVASLCLLLGACSPETGFGGQPPVIDPSADTSLSQDQILSIPLTQSSGETIDLQARVCRPKGNSPGRLVVINHGTPTSAAERPLMTLGQCHQEAAQWFLRRGYVVVFVLRRGYGATGGAWAESYGKCPNPDFVRAGLETAQDINATVEYASRLPFVRKDGTIVVGQSGGGWGTIAYDSMPHLQVRGFIVMAGGRGGHVHNIPNNNCRPDLLADAAGHFGATSTTPMLWVYAENDSFFGPPVAGSLFHSFTAAGGHADFEQPGAFDGDGHHLFFGRNGSAVWGVYFENYLEAQHLSP